MNAVSDNLIHFLGQKDKERPDKQLEIFKSIINTGLRFNKWRIKFGSAGSLSDHIACFTDIPLSFCDDHVAEYGRFGIGFKKSAIKHCGGNPARYFIDSLPDVATDQMGHRWSMHANLRTHSEFVLKVHKRLKENADLKLQDQHGQVLLENDALQHWLDTQTTIFSFEKETGDASNDRFYREREWRLVPLRGSLRSGSIRQDEIDGSYFYMFSREDINMIVTPDASVRAEVHKFLKELEEEDDDRLREFATNPVPLVAYDELQNW